MIKLLKIYKIFDEIDPLSEQMYRSPWILKLEFNKSKMMEKNIKMSDIHYAIISKLNMDRKKDISCFYTDDNAEKLIMRIQCNISNCDDNTNDKCDEEDIICILKTIEKTINDIILSGIKNIDNASTEPNENFIKFSEASGEFEKKTRWEIT